jgi:hypothetical protein
MSRRTFHGIRTNLTRARKIVHPHFTPRTHCNALRDPKILPDAKNKFTVTCPGALFVESVLVRHKHEK